MAKVIKITMAIPSSSFLARRFNTLAETRGYSPVPLPNDGDIQGFDSAMTEGYAG